MRLIDGDALKALIIRRRKEAKTLTGIDMVMVIDDAPIVEAAPVRRGRWQWISSTYDRTPCEMRYMCDKCHHETITHEHEPWEKYCPNCGARMDLEEQDAKEET